MRSTGGDRRVRFETAEVRRGEEPGRIVATVTLSVKQNRFEADAAGEHGPAGEARASATATLRALEKANPAGVAFSLVGVKELHVFDHDLIVVLVHSSQLPDRRLLGTAMVADNRHRAAALAVLNATNRAAGFTAEKRE
jgi:hypothetical protein